MTSAGSFHSCGTRGSTRLCWGSNRKGQLGLGDFDDRATPVAVIDGPWQFLSSGSHTTCGVSARSGYCWGANDTYALGIGDDITRFRPTRLA